MHLLLAVDMQEIVRAMPLLALAGRVLDWKAKAVQAMLRFPRLPESRAPYVHWTDAETEENFRLSEYQLHSGGQFPALSFESGSKAVHSNMEDKAKDTGRYHK